MRKLRHLMTAAFLFVATATAARNVVAQDGIASVCVSALAANRVAGVMAQARRSDGKNVAVLTGVEALFLDSQN